MANKKGQALVEFVLVFPIFLIIICTIIELGSITYQKYQLESNLDTIVAMYLRNDESLNRYVKEKKITMEVNNDDQKTTIDLTKKIDIVTPVLKSIYDNNYELKTERVFFNE